MDSAVAHDNNKPVYYKRDLIFTHLVVDQVQVRNYGNDQEFTIFYASSSK